MLITADVNGTKQQSVCGEYISGGVAQCKKTGLQNIPLANPQQFASRVTAEQSIYAYLDDLFSRAQYTKQDTAAFVSNWAEANLAAIEVLSVMNGVARQVGEIYALNGDIYFSNSSHLVSLPFNSSYGINEMFETV